MFDRFTERARKVMSLARKEAQRLHHDYIGTEHLIVALVEQEAGLASQALRKLGVDLGKVRAEVDRIVETGKSDGTEKQLPFTPRMKRVLEQALEQSKRLGLNYIGTEHLLLALIEERDGPAAEVLENLGAKPAIVRAEIANLLGCEGSGEEMAPEVLHSRVASDPRAAQRRFHLEEQAELFEVEVLRAIESRFPVGGVTAGADYRRTSLGDGFHLVVHWRPDPYTRPVVSLSIVAAQVETLREKLPDILDLVADMAAKELRRRGRGDATGV
jgi:hypothetical protein